MAKKKVFSIGSALSNGLEETVSAAHSYSGELRIEIIPIRKIELDPENPRELSITLEDLYQGTVSSDMYATKKKQDIESLQSLAKSIKEQGIINPIVVYRFGDKYRLVAGERRTLSSILADKLDIPAKILDSKPDELKISLLQWIENMERSDLSLYERLKNLEKIVHAYAMSGVTTANITVTELSQLIGCSKAQAVNYKAVLNASAEIKQLIQDNRIRNLEKAALICEVEHPDFKEHLISACLEGASLKKLKVIAQQNIQMNKAKKANQERRGRQTTQINFGVTKNVAVAQLVLNSLLNNEELSHLSSYFKNIAQDDPKQITETFKTLLMKLEELYEGAL
jgi:ParB family chromosome partitioning protein